MMILNGNVLSFRIEDKDLGAAFVDDWFSTTDNLKPVIFMQDSGDSVDVLRGAAELRNKEFDEYFIEEEISEAKRILLKEKQ